MKLKYIGIIVITLICSLALGCVEQPQASPSTTSDVPISTPTPTPTPETFLVSNAADIGLTINDFPVGWMDWGDGSFSKDSVGYHTLECEVTEYPTVDEAKQAYSESKQESSDFKLSSVGLGDDSFGWEFGPESVVVFRKANVVVDFWYYREYGNSHIRDIKKYAEIVEKKIL